MADHEKTTISVEPIWFATQRVLRTLVQVGIPAFITLAGVLPTIISALGLPVNSTVYLWLLSAAAVLTAVAAALSRVMAIPAVNEWLTHIGLGSVPRAAAQRQAAAQQVGEVSPEQITDGSGQVTDSPR
jgi:hypothetical protein